MDGSAHARRERPLGWWLKEADGRIDAAFDRALGLRGLDRRRWQVLASLARAPMAQADVAAALSRFDDDAEIGQIVTDLVGRGLVRGDPDRLELSDRGVRVQQEAAREVGVIRDRVGAALGEAGYEALIDLLMQLVDAFPDDQHRNGS